MQGDKRDCYAPVPIVWLAQRGIMAQDQAVSAAMGWSLLHHLSGRRPTVLGIGDVC